MMMTLWFMSMECVAAQGAAREAPVSARGGPPEPPPGPYVYDTVKLLRAEGYRELLSGAVRGILSCCRSPGSAS